MSGAQTRVFIARLADTAVFDPIGDQVGRVRDVVVTLRIGREAPRVLGLVVEVPRRPREGRHAQAPEKVGGNRRKALASELEPHGPRSVDLAEAVCFLASPRAGYITGQYLDVDGGYGV